MKKDSTKKPYHVEAKELSVNDFYAVKNLRINSPASAIREVWDYRAAGLTVDQARDYIRCWKTTSYHHFGRGEPQIEKSYGKRIVTMLEVATRRKAQYKEGLDRIMTLSDGELAWNNSTIRWEVAGRSIVTRRHESVSWGDRKNSRWPESKSVSYSSHLIRTDEPGTIEAYRISEYDILGAATEKKISHDLRGNWRQRVALELLGIDYEAQPQVFFKKVAVCPAFPDSVFASVYDGSPYQIGETRRETAMKDHNGGLYCYRTAREAQSAPFPDNSVLKDAQMCILAVRVSGKKIRYDNGKYAVSEMTPIEVV